MGWTLKNSALAVGISYDYGQKILKKYNESGEKGVKNLKNKKIMQDGIEVKKPKFLYLKRKLWGDKLIADTQKLLSHPQIQALLAES